MAKKPNNVLRLVELPGTGDKLEKGETVEKNNLFYTVYKPEAHHDIFNADLAKKDQKWIRPTFPDFTTLTKAECAEIFKREIRRIKYGVYVWINGELNYLTGAHYFTLTHWKLLESSTDYSIYTDTQMKVFYFLDLCAKDDKCAGAIIFSIKRFGKSEIAQSEMFSDAMLADSGKYIVQALNDEEAIDIFKKTFYANEHLNESLPVWPYKHTKVEPPHESLVALNRKQKIDSIEWLSIEGKRGEIEFMVKPTKLAAIQGKKTRRIFFDEFISLKPVKDMVLRKWKSKAVAQCTEDMGSIVIGKTWLIATAENVDSESLEDGKEIWEGSDNNKTDENGYPISMFRRMFIPYYLANRGAEFTDEFGKPKNEIAKAWYAKKLAGLTQGERVNFRRQNPETVDDIFSPTDGGGLEADCKEILDGHLDWLIKQKDIPRQYVNIYTDNGEIVRRQKEAHTEDEQDKWVEILEEPHDNVTYVVGIDGTNTSKETSESTKRKSRFAITVLKLFEGIDHQNYFTVCNYAVIPEKMEDLIKMAYYITVMYNKFNRCSVMAEGNVGIGDAIVSYFENRGAKHLIRQQPKYFGTDSKEVKNKLTTYADEHVNFESLRLFNLWIRRHGRNERSIRVVKDWLKTGLKNADISSATRVALLGSGNFDPETQKPKVEIIKKPARMQVQYNNGKYEIGMV